MARKIRRKGKRTTRGKAKRTTKKTGYVASVVYKGKTYSAVGLTPTSAKRRLLMKLAALIKRKRGK